MNPHLQEPCDHNAVCKIRIDKSCLVEQGKGCMFYSRPHPAPAVDHAKQENISDHPELKLPPTKEWTLGMVYAFEAGLEEGRKQAQPRSLRSTQQQAGGQHE